MPNTDTPDDDQRHRLQQLLERVNRTMPAAIRLRTSLRQHMQDCETVCDALASALAAVSACTREPRVRATTSGDLSPDRGDVPPDQGGAQ